MILKTEMEILEYSIFKYSFSDLREIILNQVLKRCIFLVKSTLYIFALKNITAGLILISVYSIYFQGCSNCQVSLR
jgi:hypothetical protein